MLQTDEPRDHVIAKGRSHSLHIFIETTFKTVGVNATNHTETDVDLMRAADILQSQADPSRSTNELGWQARTHLPDLISRPVEGEAALALSATL